MSEPYNGKCPVCGGQLQDVDIVKLSCKNGDYECRRLDFEQLWDARDFSDQFIVLHEHIVDTTDLEKKRMELNKKLLADLRGLNLKEVK